MQQTTQFKECRREGRLPLGGPFKPGDSILVPARLSQRKRKLCIDLRIAKSARCWFERCDRVIGASAGVLRAGAGLCGPTALLLAETACVERLLLDFAACSRLLLSAHNS